MRIPSNSASTREGVAVVLEPVPSADQPIDFEKEWGWLDKLRPFSDGFVAAVNEDPGEPTPRPEVDEYFK